MQVDGHTSPDDDLARLRRLFLFDAVCEAGGIGQAAIHAGRTQPAVSMAINKLEASFDCQLFERGFGGSELTGDGIIVQRRVRRMLDQMERAVVVLTGQSAANAAKICRRLTDAQVRCHMAIAEGGSAAEAALSLGISQPAVHRAARQLEQNVGVSLYRRRVHNVSANPAGTEFARCLSLALYEITQAVDELAYGVRHPERPAASCAACDHGRFGCQPDRLQQRHGFVQRAREDVRLVHALPRRLTALRVGRGRDAMLNFLNEDLIFVPFDEDVTDGVGRGGTLGDIALGLASDTDIGGSRHIRSLNKLSACAKRMFRASSKS
ncbi:LysR family transcriptional regulator [Paraburkholderia tropica]